MKTCIVVDCESPEYHPANSIWWTCQFRLTAEARTDHRPWRESVTIVSEECAINSTMWLSHTSKESELHVNWHRTRAGPITKVCWNTSRLSGLPIDVSETITVVRPDSTWTHLMPKFSRFGKEKMRDMIATNVHVMPEREREVSFFPIYQTMQDPGVHRVVQYRFLPSPSFPTSRRF